MTFVLSREETNSIVFFLKESNCCYRCIIRFLGFHVFENDLAYKDPKQFLEDLINDSEENVIKNSLEESPKKLKKNTCPVCLNCFEYSSIEKFIEKWQMKNIEEYKYNSFYINVSFPKCLSVRAHSMYLHLKEKFPKIIFPTLYNTTAGKYLELPHKIFRVVASKFFSESLKKIFHPKANLSLLISIGYEDDNLEIENIKKMTRKKFSRKDKITEVSRNDISELLKEISDNEFKKHFSIPPSIPENEAFLENIEITADTIYLGGRYLKFKRNVGQTPWVIDGVSVSEHNVQDIIFDAICNVLGCKKTELTFTASGREDVDVRMLGTGRPFYIKIDNPRERQFSEQQLLEVERQIIESELVAVIKLQSIFASDIGRIKLGEEQKKKTYRALCKTSAPNIKQVLDIINKQEEDLKISQMTVMRVLHRRTLMAREKIIHRMKAIEVSGYDDLFEVELITQAGTYVKEFVHGDFNRTIPSLTSILGYPTDLVALDCTDINLVWPESYNERHFKINSETQDDVS